MSDAKQTTNTVGKPATATETPTETVKTVSQTAAKPDTHSEKSPTSNGSPSALRASSEAKKYRLELKQTRQQLTALTAKSSKTIADMKAQADASQKSIDTLTARLASQKQDAADRLHALQTSVIVNMLTAQNSLNIQPGGTRAIPASQQRGGTGPVIGGIDTPPDAPGNRLSDPESGNHALDPRALKDWVQSVGYDTPLPVMVNGKPMTVADMFDAQTGSLKDGATSTVWKILNGILSQRPYYRAQATPASNSLPVIDGRRRASAPHRRSALGSVTKRLSQHDNY